MLDGWETYTELKGTAELVLKAFDKPVPELKDGKLVDLVET